MVSRSVWIVIVLVAGLACGGGETTNPASSDAGRASGGPEPVREAEHDRPAATGGEAATRPDTPKEVVIALIEAFRAGDRETVEALWARDGGTWSDDEGFRERAARYRQAEFDLDPDAIVVDTSQGTPMVMVPAKQDGLDHTWRFLIAEIDGELRAGGVEVYLTGMP